MHKKISIGGMSTALTVIVLLLSVYLPSGKAALVFLASTLVYITTFLIGRKFAFATYVAAFLLFFIIGGYVSPLITISFGLCFGNYPIILTFLERKKAYIRISIKFLLFNFYYVSVWFLVLLVVEEIPYPIHILYFISIVLFVMYDYLIKRTGNYIIYRLFPRIK